MDILAKLKAKICKINVTIEENEIPENEGLLKAGVIDSFGFVELVTYIEDEFEIEFAEGEIDEHNFKNIVAIANFIQNKLVQKSH